MKDYPISLLTPQYLNKTAVLSKERLLICNMNKVVSVMTFVNNVHISPTHTDCFRLKFSPVYTLR